MMSPRVSWRYDRTTEPWLRWLTRISGGVLYGTASLVVIAGVAALVAVALDGSTTVRLLVVVLALVGGPVSLLYLLPVLGDTEQRQALSLGENSVLTRRERAVVTVSGAATVTVTFVVDPRLVGGLLAVGLGSWLLAATCASQGYLDPETATVATRHREWDLDAVTGFEARGIGPLTVITFDAAGSGATGRPPRVLFVPRKVEPAISETLEAMTTGAEGAREPTREPNRLVRVVAILFAALATMGAVGLATLDGLPGALSWYLSAVCLLFAGLFLTVARSG